MGHRKFAEVGTVDDTFAIELKSFKRLKLQDLNIKEFKNNSYAY